MDEVGSTPKQDGRPGGEPPDEDLALDVEADGQATDWFEPGEPVPNDYVDPELSRLTRRPSLLQLLLVLVVLGFGGFVAYTLRFEAAYCFASDEPIDLGAAEDLSVALESQPDLLTDVGSNVYVHVAGIPQRRAVSGDSQFAQLVGAPIFIEQEREDLGRDPIYREVRTRRSPSDNRTTRYYIETEGRLLQFGDMGRRYAGMIEFYRDGYDLWFCGQPLTPRQQDFRRLTANELAEELGRQPTEAELDAAHPCVEAVLIQGGRAPADHFWYVAALGFIALIELIGLWYVLRWMLRFRSTRAPV